MVCYGYLRASTDMQDITHRIPEIERFAAANRLGLVNFIRDEVVSGNTDWTKRKISEIIDTARRGDWIVVQEMSRLSRKPPDILVIKDLLSSRRIMFHAVMENITWDSRSPSS